MTPTRGSDLWRAKMAAAISSCTTRWSDWSRSLKGERAEEIRVVERSGKPARVRAPREFGSGYGASNSYGASRESYGRRATQDPSTLPQLEGTVRRFDAERGFGFISSTSAAEDVFFHSSVVAGGDVRQGDTVEFRLGQGQKGLRALDVRVTARGF